MLFSFIFNTKNYLKLIVCIERILIRSERMQTIFLKIVVFIRNIQISVQLYV